MRQIENEVMKLKSEIEEAMGDLSEAKGTLKAHLDSLSERFELANEDDAKKRIDDNIIKIEEMKEDIRGKFKTLQETYEW